MTITCQSRGLVQRRFDDVRPSSQVRRGYVAPDVAMLGNHRAIESIAQRYDLTSAIYCERFIIRAGPMEDRDIGTNVV